MQTVRIDPFLPPTVKGVSLSIASGDSSVEDMEHGKKAVVALTKGIDLMVEKLLLRGAGSIFKSAPAKAIAEKIAEDYIMDFESMAPDVSRGLNSLGMATRGVSLFGTVEFERPKKLFGLLPWWGVDTIEESRRLINPGIMKPIWPYSSPYEIEKNSDRWMPLFIDEAANIIIDAGDPAIADPNPGT